MKKLLIIIVSIFLSCDIGKTNSNVVKIASFDTVLDSDDIQEIYNKYKIKIQYIKLFYTNDFIKILKDSKPDIVIAPNYLNKKLIDLKLVKDFTISDEFSTNITESTKLLSNLIYGENNIRKTVPFYLEDIKVFSNNESLSSHDNISLTEMLKNSQLNIVMEKNPRLIGWVAMYINDPKIILKPWLIANPDQQNSKTSLNKLLNSKINIKFQKREEILKNWNKIDVFIGSNWIQNLIKSSHQYKKIINIENANLITLHSLVKTKYANNDSLKVLTWMQENYADSLISKLYNPVTIKESQSQYDLINENNWKAMIFSNQQNYYYFTNEKYNNSFILKILDKFFIKKICKTILIRI